MIAFDRISGTVHEVDIVRLEQIAVDASTVCRLLGYAPGSTIVEIEKQPGFPLPMLPTGKGERRWIVSEVLAWAKNVAPRGTSPSMVRGAAKRRGEKAASKRREENIQ